MDNYNIELSVKFPRIEIRGKYDVSGNVLLFPVRSKGDFWAIFRKRKHKNFHCKIKQLLVVAVDVDGAAKIFGKEFKDKQNIRYMRIEKMLVDFKLQKSRFRVRDVINHGNILGEAMNQFLNNNADEIIREMKPAATVSIARHFKGFLNSAFLQLPLKVWLPDA